MGLLSESSSGMDKLGHYLKRLSSLLGFISYIGGIIYFCVVVAPPQSRSTYFSENALLPGVVDENFHNGPSIVDSLAMLKAVAKPSKGETYIMPHNWLKKQFLELGLEAYVQNFTLTYPLAVSEKLEGNNVYGIVRAPRGSSTEAIVVAVPYKMDSFPAIAVMLGFAQFCREQIFWAKDIIFVIAEHGEIGILAWLNVYHEKFNEYLFAENLMARGGAIQAAIVLDSSTEHFSQADVKFNMLDGQLPNLDLFNLAVRMIEKQGVTPTIFKRVGDWGDSLNYDIYSNYVQTAFLGIVNQASGRVEGLHSVFGGFGIDAVMIEPRNVKGYRNGAGNFEVARVLEGMLRSINNLLERLHQSFFFYVLPSPHQFVSIGLYMPAVGLMLLAPLLKAATLWLESNEKAEAEADGTINNEGSNTVQVDNTLLGVAPCLVISHILGVLFRLLPVYVRALSGPKTSPDDNLMATAFGLTIALFYFPRMLIKKRKADSKPPSPSLLRCLALLELTAVVGVTSVLNFGLGFLLCLVWIPVCTMAGQSSSRPFRFVQYVLLALINPLILIFLTHVTYLTITMWAPTISFEWLARAAYDGSKTTIVTVVLDSYLYGSWQFNLVTTALVPVWTLFWSLLAM